MATLCVRSATLAVCNVFWISTPSTLRPWICSPSCATTTSSWGPTCARRVAFATSMEMLPV